MEARLEPSPPPDFSKKKHSAFSKATQNPTYAADLSEVVASWPTLSPAIRAAILSIVQSQMTIQHQVDPSSSGVGDAAAAARRRRRREGADGRRTWDGGLGEGRQHGNLVLKYC